MKMANQNEVKVGMKVELIGVGGYGVVKEVLNIKCHGHMYMSFMVENSETYEIEELSADEFRIVNMNRTGMDYCADIRCFGNQGMKPMR